MATEQQSSDVPRSTAGCNVSSTFNFSVGAIALLAAFAIAYFVYRYYWLR